MNLNLLLPMKLCAKIGGNWPSSSTEEDFLISSKYFPYFLCYLPLEKGVDPHLKKSESPSPKNTLCQFWLKLTYPVVLKKKKKCDSQADGSMTGNQISSLELLAQMS